MKLIIDIGNTRVKAAIFEGNELLESFAFPAIQELLDSGLIRNPTISSAILATVVSDPSSLITALQKNFPVLLFKADTPVPVTNLYRTAGSLGSDRLAVAAGAAMVAPGKNCLVIDAGTCIKYNFISSENEFLGGAISPGLQMRFRAMNTFTGRLPLLSAEKEPGDVLGRSSEGSMHSGAEWGAIYEMQGFIDYYEKAYSGLKVFLTGGDTEFFAGRLKNRIFADPFLVLKGLNRILGYNIKE